MNLRITYQTPEGGVAVIIPTDDCGLTIEQIAAKDVPAGIPYKIVDVSSIPSDRTFRNAWEHCPVNGTKVNTAKAKAIHLDVCANCVPLSSRRSTSPTSVPTKWATLRASETSPPRSKPSATSPSPFCLTI